MHTWQAWPQKPPELPSASSSVLKYLYGQEGFVPDVSSKGSLLPCELISACHPAENTKISFLSLSSWLSFVLQGCYHLSHQFYPLWVWIGAPAVVSHRCYSEPLLTLIALPWMVPKQPQISPCAAPEPGPALGRSSGSLQGHQQWESHPVCHSKGSFVSHCWLSFTPLHLCVQSLLSMCDRTHRYISVS